MIPDPFELAPGGLSAALKAGAAAPLSCRLASAGMNAATGAAIGAGFGAAQGFVEGYSHFTSMDDAIQGAYHGALSGAMFGGAVGGITGFLNSFICFTGRTPVLTEKGRKRIDTVEPCQRVLTEVTKAEDGRDTPTQVDPATWRLMHLRMERANGNIFEARMVRPLSWIKEAGATVGSRILLSLRDIEVEGMAEVLAIGPCPPVKRGRGRVVTAVFTQSACSVLEIRIRESDDVLEPTPVHRIFSEDRQDYVPAAQLKAGERLRTKSGIVTVESIRPGGAERVYNLEVEGEHHFYVGTHAVLAHNAYSDSRFAVAQKEMRLREKTPTQVHNEYLVKALAREYIDAEPAIQTKYGARDYDGFNIARRTGFEANTTPWNQMTRSQFDRKLIQIEKDTWAINNSVQSRVNRVVWFGTEELPTTGYGGQIRARLQRAGIPYYVVTP
ncbi:MAG: Hint domain-containing protein [Tepidisphaerales bacterium]